MYALTIGVFDGVHKGHQYILRNLLEIAEQVKLEPLAIIFKYPAEKYLGGFEGLILPSWKRKEICEKMGIKVIVKDMQEIWGISHVDYLNNLLKKDVKAIVCGRDFTFGKDALGDVKYLKAASEKKGFIVKVLEDLKNQGDRISSSVIKRELKMGNISFVNNMLGRNWTLEGPVYEDRHVGFKLGFPTANIDVFYKEQILLPKFGVYLVKGYIKGREGSLWGLMNVGLRPTFFEDKKLPKVEVYFLDFFGDLYNEYITLEVLDFLREEKKFNNQQELIQAMEKDEDNARRIIQKNYN
ncbi:riboflavin biosynthesis protein RibF [Petrotoga sp. 9PWA.NaAc.5.4]|uniref:riboflavin biosynthesis protein RibF n=1 Tax=Petrotoga sp. 9PWA.NaAc.5.4 TaxID=1434328 RepID=UPI000CB1515F|nr:riboflavin biosynthesis protein RibF [Petrotoga sp. 9PWA.NaAc.5.4]PNR97033.1 riboflavin biosynthesis protein RibF [Petrotoga sp. 9PWA.NaAc.5.4]